MRNIGSYMDSRQSYKHMLSALDSRPLQHADCPLLLTSLYPLGEKGACRHHPTKLERLGESVLHEFTKLGCRPELRNGIQFFECRSERIGKTPDGSRPEFLVLWLEVEVMHCAGKMFRCLQSALNKRFVDDNFGSDACQFTSRPSFHLLSHRLKVSLHSINANRDAVDERKGLRVFREDRGKSAWDDVSESPRPVGYDVD